MIQLASTLLQEIAMSCAHVEVAEKQMINSAFFCPQETSGNVRNLQEPLRNR